MNRLMTKADASKVLGITPDSVVFLEKKGLLRGERTAGGVRLFREADVLALATKRDLERRAKASRTPEALP